LNNYSDAQSDLSILLKEFGEDEDLEKLLETDQTSTSVKIMRLAILLKLRAKSRGTDLLQGLSQYACLSPGIMAGNSSLLMLAQLLQAPVRDAES
jgi:hypothetical protein